VISKIAELFPRRRVGPLALRRIFVSSMQEIAASNKEEFKNWDSDHAALINTSAKVLEDNYNRFNNRNRSVEVLNRVNTSLDLVPSDDIIEKVQQHCQDVQYLDASSDAVIQVLNERYKGRELQYLCLRESGEEEWMSSHVLDPFCDLVLEYFTRTCNKSAEEEASLSFDQVSVKSRGENNNEPVPSLQSGSWSESSLSEYWSSQSSSEDSSAESSSSEDDSSLGNSSYSKDLSMEVDEYMTEVAVAVSTVNNNNAGKKRKRPHEKEFEVVCLGDRPLKPGDVVSVNPSASQSSQDFWLAVVKAVANEDSIKVQWLDKVKDGQYKLINHFDFLEVLTLNGHASGKWLTTKCYTIE